jgi:hypothetical protein
LPVPVRLSEKKKVPQINDLEDLSVFVGISCDFFNIAQAVAVELLSA